jgi:hypothetical protein
VETLTGEALGVQFRGHRGSLQQPGYWRVKVESSPVLGGVKLGFDPDLNHCVVKK